MRVFPGELTRGRLESLRRRTRAMLRTHHPALFHVRTLPVPEGEPAHTLREWESAWQTLERFIGAEVTIEEASELVRLYARLDAFGVAFTPEAREWAATMRALIGRADAELCNGDEGQM